MNLKISDCNKLHFRIEQKNLQMGVLSYSGRTKDDPILRLGLLIESFKLISIYSSRSVDRVIDHNSETFS